MSGTKGETELARHAIAAVRLVYPACVAIRVHSGIVRVKRGFMHLAEIGTPDWLLMMPKGRQLWLEFKLPGERPTDEQIAWHKRACALGHDVAVVQSIEETVEVVRSRMRAA